MRAVLGGVMCAMLCATAVRAQEAPHVIHGRVVDEATGAPVPGAAVWVGASAADPDSAGVFRLCTAKPGPASVVVRASGYDPLVTPLRISARVSGPLMLRVRQSLPARPPRLGHGPGAYAHRTVLVVNGERLRLDHSGCTPSPEAERTVRELPARAESVYVLKGPEAVARFGPDARHGAVVVTTKRAAAQPR